MRKDQKLIKNQASNESEVFGQHWPTLHCRTSMQACTWCSVHFRIMHLHTVQYQQMLPESPQLKVRLLQVMNCSVFINHAKLSALTET